MKYRRHLVALAAALVLVLVLVATFQTGDARAAVTTSIQLMVKGDLTATSGLAASSAPSIVQRTLALANGVSAGQADMVWSDRRQIAASTTEDLDVDDGGLTDAFGTTFTIAKLKILVIVADGSNTNNLVVLGDANSVPILDTAAATIDVEPGGILVIASPAAGYAVTASTGDIVQVANGGGGSVVDYDVLIIGTSS